MVPNGNARLPSAMSANNDNMFFATVVEDKEDQQPIIQQEKNKKGVQLFSDDTLREANDALTSVGWSGVAPASSSLTISEDQMGELTSDDPFVKVSQLHEAVFDLYSINHQKAFVLWLINVMCSLFQ
jgi:hypothetical protein